MDFKFKAIGWVGGIYQKFETLCHEVDNIVNQDTVKYVENQAQSMGKSMKRFCSDVIHDMLPPLDPEGQEVALEGSAKIDAYVKSKGDIEEDHIDSVSKLSHVEPVAVDQIEQQLDHACKEHCTSDKLSSSISMDALKSTEPEIMSGQVCDFSKKTSSDLNIEENAIMEKTSGSEVRELISHTEEESSGASLVNEFIDCNDKDSCGVLSEVSLTMPVHDIEFASTQKEGTINNIIAVDVLKEQLVSAFSEPCLGEQLGNPNSVDSLLGTECITSELVADISQDTKPEVNIEENATTGNPSASEEQELISPTKKESSRASLLSEYIDCNDKEPCGVEPEVAPATSVHAMTKPSGSNVLELVSSGQKESFGASLVHAFVNCDDKNLSVVRTDVFPANLVHGDQNARTIKDFAYDSEDALLDPSGGITSSKMTSSVIHSDENMAEVGFDLKKYNLPENSPQNSPAKALIDHDPVDVAEFVSHNLHSSRTLTPLLSCEKKFTTEGSMSSSHELSMESLETDASRTVNGTNSLTGISGNKNVCFGGESSQFQALSSSDIGLIHDSIDDINVSSMETIELSDEGKLEDSCVIVDSTALSAVSRIMRKHRSYKKIIQDALTSKKRLEKEYEQLSIWFGDADMGSNRYYLQMLRPSSTTALECENGQPNLLCDSEWELL